MEQKWVKEKALKLAVLTSFSSQKLIILLCRDLNLISCLSIYHYLPICISLASNAFKMRIFYSHVFFMRFNLPCHFISTIARYDKKRHYSINKNWLLSLVYTFIACNYITWGLHNWVCEFLTPFSFSHSYAFLHLGELQVLILHMCWNKMTLKLMPFLIRAKVHALLSVQPLSLQF